MIFWSDDIWLGLVSVKIGVTPYHLGTITEHWNTRYITLQILKVYVRMHLCMIHSYKRHVFVLLCLSWMIWGVIWNKFRVRTFVWNSVFLKGGWNRKKTDLSYMSLYIVRWSLIIYIIHYNTFDILTHMQSLSTFALKNENVIENKIKLFFSRLPWYFLFILQSRKMPLGTWYKFSWKILPQNLILYPYNGKQDRRYLLNIDTK